MFAESLQENIRLDRKCYKGNGVRIALNRLDESPTNGTRYSLKKFGIMKTLI